MAIAVEDVAAVEAKKVENEKKNVERWQPSGSTKDGDGKGVRLCRCVLVSFVSFDWRRGLCGWSVDCWTMAG